MLYHPFFGSFFKSFWRCFVSTPVFFKLSFVCFYVFFSSLFLDFMTRVFVMICGDFCWVLGGVVVIFCVICMVIM